MHGCPRPWSLVCFVPYSVCIWIGTHDPTTATVLNKVRSATWTFYILCTNMMMAVVAAAAVSVRLPQEIVFAGTADKAMESAASARCVSANQPPCSSGLCALRMQASCQGVPGAVRAQDAIRMLLGYACDGAVFTCIVGWEWAGNLPDLFAAQHVNLAFHHTVQA